MRRLALVLALGGVLAACGAGAHGVRGETETGETTGMTWPETPGTERQDVAETLFGVHVDDPYRWLEDVADPRVEAWMTAQDEVARKALGALPRREAFAERLRQVLYVDSVSTPTVRGGRLFYERTRADQEKAIVMWREGEAGPERVLLDPNTMSDDGSTSVGEVVPSPDGRKIAFSLRENNADEATLYVMDVDTGARSDVDVIEGAKYAEPQWLPDGSGFVYTWLPTDDAIPVDQRPGYAEVRYHALGTPASADVLIHERTGSPETFIAPSLSHDGRWLVVYVHHGWNASDVWIRDRSKPDAPFEPFAVGLGAHFTVTPWDGWFYIATDLDAPRWRVLRTRWDEPGRDRWQEIIPESPEAVIDETRVAGGHLVLRLQRKASSHLEIRDLDGSGPRAVTLPGLGAIDTLRGEPDQATVWFDFASFTLPPRVMRLDLPNGEPAVWEAVELPIDPSPYLVEQLTYPSKDGTEVTLFVVRRRDMPFDGSTPLLLGGYGGFNISMLPRFAATLYPWLEAGGAYAVPNLRGGGEYGEAWHQGGMGPRKQNVFDDYVAAAEHLIALGYTKPERLAIRGGSNGGLLVGAAMTQRPDLYRAVICAVPLLDMVRYHLFGSGRTWISEYGSAETEDGFRTLYAYSPYHHVHPGVAYPALLMLSADSDDRVDPMHARKLTAAIQAATSSGRPVLLRIERNAGHGGADLVRQNVAMYADVYAFLLAVLEPAPAAK